MKPAVITDYNIKPTKQHLLNFVNAVKGKKRRYWSKSSETFI